MRSKSGFGYVVFGLVIILLSSAVGIPAANMLWQQSQNVLFLTVLFLLALAFAGAVAVGTLYSKLYTSRQQCLMLLRDLAFERREHATFRTDAQAQIRTLRAKLRAETESAQQSAAGARDRIQSIHGLHRAGFTADYTSLVQTAQQQQQQQETAILNPVTVAVATTLLDFSVDTAGSHQVCEPVTTYTPPTVTSSHAAECSTFSSGGDSGGGACDSGSGCSGD